jgi:hypothetical protein
MMYASKALEVLRPIKAVFLEYLRPALYVLASLIILMPAQGQGTAASQSNAVFTDTFTALKPGGFLHPTLPGCTSAAKNDLRSRACFYANDLLGPSAVAHALFSSSFSELVNHPNIWRQDRADTLNRFAFFYEAKAARDGAQLLAGYLHRENFRPITSGKIGIASRTRAALLSVLRASGPDGETKMAFAPIAGALCAGFTGAADYRNHGFVETGFRYAAGAYGFRFGSAVFQEFKPDLLTLSNRFTRRFR